jgi:hypothetical protein
MDPLVFILLGPQNLRIDKFGDLNTAQPTVHLRLAIG